MNEESPAPAVRRNDRLWLALLAGAVVLVADQFIKWYVVVGLRLREIGTIDVAPPVLRFHMAWNTGVNFGIGDGNPALTLIPLVVLSLAAAGVALWVSRRMPARAQAIGCGIAAGGAIGNAVDRLHWGAVADFLNMSCCGINNPWSFNVADIAIFAGLAMVVVLGPRNRST